MNTKDNTTFLQGEKWNLNALVEYQRTLRKRCDAIVSRYHIRNCNDILYSEKAHRLWMKIIARMERIVTMETDMTRPKRKRACSCNDQGAGQMISDKVIYPRNSRHIFGWVLPLEQDGSCYNESRWVWTL